MNLRTRATEKAILAAAEREFVADASAAREFDRRHQRIKTFYWKARIAFWLVLMSAIPLVSLGRATVETRAGWAMLVLALGFCAEVAGLVNQAMQRALLLHRLPIADSDIFRVAWRDILIKSLWLLPGFWCLFHWLVPQGNRDEVWLHALAAVLLVAALLATVCIAIAWLRAAAWAQWALNIGWFGAIAVQFSGDGGHPLIRAAVDQIAVLLRLATPPGWVLTWFIERPGGEMKAALWLLPVVAAFALSRNAWFRMRDSYSVPETTPSLPQLTPMLALQMEQLRQRNELAGEQLVGPTAIEDSLKARDFLRERPGLDVGWLDRRIMNWLTARERVLLDFMVVVVPQWTKNCQRGVAAAIIAVILSEFTRLVRPADFWLISAFGGAMGLLLVLPVANGLARAFIACPVAGGSPLTFVGCLPLSYAEVLRLDLKISVVRAVAALPLVLAFGTALAWQLKVGPGLGLAIAMKVWLLVLAFRPFMIAAHFSAGTNDSQLSRLRGWALVGFAIVVAFTLIGLGVASVAAKDSWSWLLIPPFALVSWGFYAVHRWCYDHMVFDLQPSTSLGQHPVG